MKKYLFILIHLYSFISCTMSDNAISVAPDILTRGNDVPSTYVVNLSDYGINTPVRISKHGDILAVGQRYELTNVHLVNLSTHSTQPWLPMGEGQNEAYSIDNLSINGHGDISAFDFETGKLHRCNPSSLSRSTTPPLTLASTAIHLSAVQGDNFVISTGLYEQGRYRYYSLEDESEEYFIDYPVHPGYPDLSPYSTSILWASTVLSLRPDNQMFVCTDIRSGQIDFCRIEGKKISLVCRHCYYYPHVDARDKGDVRVAYYSDNITGFRDVTVSDDRVFVLYSGKTYKDEKQNIANCSTLLVFDWDGTLLETRTLPQMATFISYDMEENALYGTTPDAQLVRYNI